MDVAASEFFTEDKKYDLDFKTENNDKSKVITGCAPPAQHAGGGHPTPGVLKLTDTLRG